MTFSEKYLISEYIEPIWESKWRSTDSTIRRMIRLKSLKRFMSLKIHLFSLEKKI